MNKTKVVYEFFYNDCVWESASATISLHRTKKGAMKAMKNHKEELRRKHKKIYGNDKTMKFGKNEHWGVGAIEIQD